MAATASNPIILYDLPSKYEPRAWNLNTWKGRLALNYKQLPYRTEWISYPDVKPTLSKLGFKPLGIEYDGTPLYTVPAILDPTTSTPTTISESTDIAQYLDDAYPSTPKLFPEGTKDAQLKFIKFALTNVVSTGLLLTKPGIPSVLDDPKGVEYYIRVTTGRLGLPLNDLCPAGSEERKEAWKNLKKALDDVADIYDKNVEGNGELFTGQSITFADILLAAFFLYLKAVPSERDGEDIKTTWDVVQGLNEGRWAKLLAKFDDYVQVL